MPPECSAFVLANRSLYSLLGTSEQIWENISFGENLFISQVTLNFDLMLQKKYGDLDATVITCEYTSILLV